MFAIDDSASAQIPTLFDSKMCNFYIDGAYIIVETIDQYLDRVDELIRMPEVPVLMLLPKEGYDLPEAFPIEDFASVLFNFEGKQYAFRGGVGRDNFEEITVNSDMGWIKLVSITTEPTTVSALGSRYYELSTKQIYILKNSGWTAPETPSDKAIYYFDKSFYIWDGTELIKVGSINSTVKIQYSTDGTATWHTTYTDADYFIRFSVDGGETWGDAARFRGENVVEGLTPNYVPKWNGTKLVDSAIYNGVNGRVGIGTTNPAVELDIIGQVQISATLYTNRIGALPGYGPIYIAPIDTSNAAMDGMTYGFGTESFIVRETNDGNDLFCIFKNGNVSIGYSADTELPAKLTVNGNGYFNGNITASGYKIPFGTSSQYLLADGTYTTVSGSVYKGEMNGSTGNVIASGVGIDNGTGTIGWYYACSVAGTHDYGSGNITLSVGDQLYYNGTVWLRIPGAGSYSLPTATSSQKGGVIIGSGISVALDGTISVTHFSGNYNDLTNKPTIPEDQVNSDWNSTSGLSQILNKPTIPAAQVQTDWNATSGMGVILNKPTLFSGNYNDLSNKPTIPAAQVNSDWNSTSGLSRILNKPTLFSGSYTDLTNKPTIPSGQINSDWNSTSGLSQILNKPTLFDGTWSSLSGKPSLFSGSYTDLTNKPSIPAAQVNSDWNAVVGYAVILNKPTLFSGSYNDLTDKPTIPSSMIYPASGIALSTGSAWGTSIANNSANWNTAYSLINPTGIGLVGDITMDSVTNTASEWSALPVGYARFMDYAIGTVGGLPSGSYGYFTKIANRNVFGGWAGLWLGNSTESSYIGSSDTSATLATWRKIWDSGNANLATADWSTKNLTTNGTTYLNGGNVLIGTTTNVPGLKLQVAGSMFLANNNTFLYGRTSNGSIITLLGVDSQNHVTMDDFGLGVIAGGDITAQNFILNSDKRLKTNIKPINLSPININYKEYEFKNKKGDTRYGLIAQELQITNPELVCTDNDGYLSVKYIDLMIREIASLKHRIKELEG